MRCKAERRIKEESCDRHGENRGKDKQGFCLFKGLGKTDSTSEAAVHSAQIRWFILA